jgi:hypothetical protein
LKNFFEIEKPTIVEIIEKPTIVEIIEKPTIVEIIEKPTSMEIKKIFYFLINPKGS